MKQPIHKQPIHSTNKGKELPDKEETTMHPRSKRQSIRPQYLKDFITNSDKGH